jgi:16S rRNA (guanine527-N7)-methyltransferase
MADVKETESAETVEATEEKVAKAPKSPAKLEEEGDIAADYLEGLLDIADLDGDIDIDVENGRAALAIVGGKLKHLVGAEGEVLDSIQELTRLAVQTATGDRSRLMLDIDGFRAGRRKELTALAEKMAEQAKTTGSSIKLDPMNAFERKIIHDTIQTLGLTSESDGEDPYRFVVISQSLFHVEHSVDALVGRYFPERESEIRAFAEFLLTAGIERGLIGPREGERIWDRHIFNCLPVTQLLPQGASLFDIGSGAGLPGIVIALARPDLQVTLIEPLERRVEFLKEATAGTNIEVIRGRAQDVKKSADFLTARAVAPLEKLKKMSWHMVKTNGALLAMKGEGAAAEMVGMKNAKLHEITLEGIGLGRIVELRKGSPVIND